MRDRWRGRTEGERAYVEMLEARIEDEMGGILPRGVGIRSWVNETWRDRSGGVRQRKKPQEKRLIYLGNGRAFVPHEDGSNGTDDRATELLSGRVPESEISAETLIRLLERERDK